MYLLPSKLRLQLKRRFWPAYLGSGVSRGRAYTGLISFLMEQTLTALREVFMNLTSELGIYGYIHDLAPLLTALAKASHPQLPRHGF